MGKMVLTEEDPGPLRFQYTLRRSPDAKFGFQVSFRSGQGACIVKEVTNSGLTAQKNFCVAAIPELRSQQLLPGDRVMVANGKSGIWDIREELHSSVVLHLAIERVLSCHAGDEDEAPLLAWSFGAPAAAVSAASIGGSGADRVRSVPEAGVLSEDSSPPGWGAAEDESGNVWQMRDPWIVESGTESTATGGGSGSGEDQRHSDQSSLGAPSLSSGSSPPRSPPDCITGEAATTADVPTGGEASRGAGVGGGATVEHAVLAKFDEGGLFECFRDYNPCGVPREPEDGYLALRTGARVFIYPQTRQNGVNNLFEEYVFGRLDSVVGDGEEQGWLPTALLMPVLH